MATQECPMCKGACIIKLIATSDARWCEVDVCRMCGTMYPRNRHVVIAAPARPEDFMKPKPAKAKGGKKAKGKKAK